MENFGRRLWVFNGSCPLVGVQLQDACDRDETVSDARFDVG